jgi:hypothetical protein
MCFGSSASPLPNPLIGRLGVEGKQKWAWMTTVSFPWLGYRCIAKQKCQLLAGWDCDFCSSLPRRKVHKQEPLRLLWCHELAFILRKWLRVCLGAELRSRCVQEPFLSAAMSTHFLATKTDGRFPGHRCRLMVKLSIWMGGFALSWNHPYLSGGPFLAPIPLLLKGGGPSTGRCPEVSREGQNVS